MSVGTKLTFWVVVFPISLIVALSFGVFYLYQASLEASVVVEIMSTLSSVVLVDLLVWERLRDSLSKKLEYIDDNYLSELYSSFKRGSVLAFWAPPVKSVKPDLKRYGKFIGIFLYPKDLLNMVDDFLISYENFNKRWTKIKSIGEEFFDAKFNQYIWCHLLGIEYLDDQYLKSHQDKAVFKSHEDKAMLVEKEHTKLLQEIKEYHKEAKRIQKMILERLEDFFKSNNLEFKPEIW